jgi:LmbE family N-acetylglucosaminyl deacetylase
VSELQEPTFAEQLVAALREARPYVVQQIIPPGHPDRDWRAETAENVLQRVDAALGKVEA